MEAHPALHVLGFAGSLRRGSYNKALLRAARELAPAGIEIEIFDLAEIPLYNADVEAEGFPAPVRAFREAVRHADALLIATPEYNHGIPGVLKNAIDWASRGGRESPLRGKPVAILGASTSLMGTVRAQGHLRQVLAATSSYVLPQPQVLVTQAAGKFDAEGRLTDEQTRSFVGKLLSVLAGWTLRFRKEDPVAA